MKAPARRRGNKGIKNAPRTKSAPSMKVPAQRQRNLADTDEASKGHYLHLRGQSAIELVIPPPLPRDASE